MNIYKKIPLIMNELEAIGKDKRNTTQGFNYRGIDDFYNALSPLFAKHGIFSVPEVLDELREVRNSKSGGQLNYVRLRVKYTFFSDDGSSVVSIVQGEGMDSGDKASNKALAIAHKYALMQIFAVPTEDLVDPDAESHEMAASNKITQELKSPVKPLAASNKEKKITWPDVLNAGTKNGWNDTMVREWLGKTFKLRRGDSISQDQLKQTVECVSKTNYAKAMEALGQPIGLEPGHGKPDAAFNEFEDELI